MEHEEKRGLAKVLSDVFVEEEKPTLELSSPVPKEQLAPTLKEQLAEVLKEAPTMEEVIKNPWMYDPFLRKVKVLTE